MRALKRTGLFILASLIIVSLTGHLCLIDPMEMDIAHRLEGVSRTHIFGTDAFGRDVLSLSCAGFVNSLLVALGGVGLGSVIGSSMGVVAALSYNRAVARALIVLSDFVFIFPALLIALLLASLYRPSMFNIIAAIALFTVPVFLQLTLSNAMSVLASPALFAAKALGQTRFGLARLHIIPVLVPILLTQVTVQLALAFLTEAALSYLGLGIPLQQPSLGRMMQEAQSYLDAAPRLVIVPGAIIILTVMALYMVGNGLSSLSDRRQIRVLN